MDYNHIKDYLSKFREILFSKEEVYKIIGDIIEKNTLIKIEQKFIKIKGNIIYIKASPVVCNEILIHKEKILKDLSQIYKEILFKDIR
jgi:parvulin-like peptidyl-prolyl isomerase